ncbi:hypothetical protein LEN26_014535 [Aphanomyces euteiches]|nr:hypothetical protein LEN26_014535 [Aphanomyces euteiches]KAH9112661.1 hypothetical protein AeMF1_013048 [Aphanomyces euteiches]KAH9195641.1 hypothetical protein AeNC1_002391 [Aphanomyces euteiches]
MGDKATRARRHEVVAAIRRAETALSSGMHEEYRENDILSEFRRLALAPGGFQDFRKQVWPLLLGFSTDDVVSFYSEHHIKIQVPPFMATKHRDDTQIQMDVNRSLGGTRWSDVKGLKRTTKRKALFSLVHAAMCVSKEVHYYQGFHDVASVFLVAVGMPLSIPLVARMAQTYLGEPTRSNFDTVLPLFRYLYPLLQSQDPALYKHIASSVDHAYFALPWVITWFSHDIDSFQDVARLYDVLLASHPIFSLYVSAALILLHRDTILACDADFGILHTTLQNLPSSMDVEETIQYAYLLYENIPPEDLAVNQTSLFWTFPFPHQRRLGVREKKRKEETSMTLTIAATAVGSLAVAFATHHNAKGLK